MLVNFKFYSSRKRKSRTLQDLFHSVIHSDYFYSASSSPLLLRGTPDKARILCRSFTLKRNRQLRVKDLPNVPRAGFELTTLWTKGIESTNEPPHPTQFGTAKLNAKQFLEIRLL